MTTLQHVNLIHGLSALIQNNAGIDSDNAARLAGQAIQSIVCDIDELTIESTESIIQEIAYWVD